jgi:hypothetical protein
MKKKLLLTFVFSIIAVTTLFASTGVDPGDFPCEDIDGCPTPLDTWVMVLAAIALIFTTTYLYHKQKAAQLAA